MSYSDKQATKIVNHVCQEIIKDRALRTILKTDNGMCSTDTFYRFLYKSEAFSKQYSRATLIRAEQEFSELISIADNKEDCYYTDKDGVRRLDNAAVQLKRLQIHTREWRLGKLNPKKYSDKVQVDTTEFKEQPLFDFKKDKE